MPNIISVTTVQDSGNPLTSYPITVPGTALGVVVFWAFDSGTNGTTVSSVSMTGAGTFTIHENVPTVNSSFERCAGVASASVSSTGSQTFNMTKSAVPNQGAVHHFVWLDEAPTYRDSDGANTALSTAISLTIASTAADLVLALDAKYNATPAAASGWTSQATALYNAQGTRLSKADSPGASTTTFDAQGEDYSAAVVVSFQGAGGGGGGSTGAAAYYYSQQ